MGMEQPNNMEKDMMQMPDGHLEDVTGLSQEEKNELIESNKLD
jgi:hypothetical protein